jgi:signal transduction histidine kinase
VQDQATDARKADGGSDGGSQTLAWIRTAWRSLNRFHSRLGLRLLARVFLFSSVITLLLTSLQLYFEYRRDVGTIDRRISEIEESYRRSLSEGLWNLDSRQLELQADGIRHLPDIRFVEVREVPDRADAMVVTAGVRQANAEVHREFPIFRTFRSTEQQLGVLSIEATLNEVYRHLFDTAIVIFASQGVKTFAVSFFILFIVHWLITRHIAATAKTLSGYGLIGSPPPPLRLHRRPPRQPDELDQLVGAFNSMCASLQTAYSELRDNEQQLAHANRVATMGQLTASIGHEVKQPIAAMVANAQAALRFLNLEPPDREEVRRALMSIVQEGHRGGDVIDRIRGVIKKGPGPKERLEINELIREVLALVRGEAVKNGVSVQTELAEGLPLILGDRVQIQQVLLNLIINALEAMTVREEARELLISSRKSDTGGVRVAVRDSGPGLGQADLERVFASFYTTKSGGMGLGLAICRSIIEAHGGRIWATMQAPRGAVFEFTLPAGPGETASAEHACRRS